MLQSYGIYINPFNPACALRQSFGVFHIPIMGVHMMLFYEIVLMTTHVWEIIRLFNCYISPKYCKI